MAKSIESDESGAENLDLEEHLQSGSVCVSDDLRVRDLGVRMRYLVDELEIPSNSYKDGPWNLVYQSVGSRLGSLKKLFKQSEVASVQPMVKVKKASLVSSAGLRRSGADWGSRRNCVSCSEVKAAVQDAAGWTLVEPLVTLINKNIKYRLSVAPGRYECRVTGLCWECPSEAELEYLLSDWEDVGEFLEQNGFRPCGPLLDVTLVSGELTAVRLPHFLCLGSSPSLSGAVRVLHVEDAGVSVEPCQLSCHSAGLLHPTFSPRGVLVRTGFSVKAHCEVLIYCTLTAHLTLHVYLVPCDAKMIESVQKQENGSIRIPKPHPDTSLQMKNRYTLSTSCSSTITPQRLKLRYTTQTPNYFEVYIKDVNEDFQLRLTSEEEEEPVWKADIRSAEYRRSPSRGGQHFVDVHRKSLIQRVKLVEPIADDLYPKISEEKYSKIAKAGTSQDKMRVIYDILLSGGPSLKDVLLQSLQQNEPDLLEELSQS